MINPTILDMSLECKAMVVKKVYEHYTMNILWREICQKISTMCVFIFSSIAYLSDKNSTLQAAIVFFSAIVSLVVTFFCDTKDYYINLHIITKVYKTKCNDPNFKSKFEKLLPLIREIDFARGRFDYTNICLEKGRRICPYDHYT